MNFTNKKMQSMETSSSNELVNFLDDFITLDRKKLNQLQSKWNCINQVYW